MTHPRPGEAYRPSDYWGGLHAGADDLGVVGYPTLPAAFNRYVYANAAVGVLRGLRRAGLTVRGRNVLDVGSGTGFWVDLWLREGAATVAGADLVPEAVERLRKRFPRSNFVTADIAERSPFTESTFDLVTIMSVLHHVVDEELFRNALANLSSQVSVGGRIVVLDPLVVRGRWMPEDSESAHNVARTRSQWETALATTGLRIASISPTAALLSDPVDARSRIGFEAHRLWWRGLTGTLRGRERLAAAVMPPLARLDRALVPLLHTGPGAKLIVIERAD